MRSSTTRSSVINATNNFSVGLTVVSGAHLVSFGGTINSSGNPVAGVSVNSKAGLDLDAASQLNSFNNGDGVLMQDDSVMTVFNTPQFSGAQGFSTINSHNNTRSGVRVLTGSTLTLVNQARVISTQNATLGLVADNGAGLTLVNSTLTGNAASDLQLTFGTRADVRTTDLRHLHLRCHRPRAWHERHHLSALETVDERTTPTRKEVVNRRLRG